MFTPYHVSCVTCHVSLVTCHMSPVMCHLSPVTCQKYLFFYIFIIKKNKKKIKILQKILDKVVELVRGGSVINGAYPVQFCVRLIFKQSSFILNIQLVFILHSRLSLTQAVGIWIFGLNLYSKTCKVAFGRISEYKVHILEHLR